MHLLRATSLVVVSLAVASCSRAPDANPPNDGATHAVAQTSTDALARFRALEAQALAGDRDAQRQVAHWLSGGNSGRPPTNAMVGCAWRLVIIDRATPAPEPEDLTHKERYCDQRLAPAQLEAAAAQARALKRSMQGGEAVAQR